MLSDVKSAEILVPPSRVYQTVATLENGWTDQYGALHEAASYCGAPLPAGYRVNAVWQHGCHGPWVDHSPALLCYNAPQASSRPVLVARPDQESLLRANGYPQARAIGLPIVYTPPSGRSRLPGSLLVVPMHTLRGDHCSDRSAFERYADEISAVAPSFDRVIVCIHPNCRANGLWVKEFAARGVQIVWGAQNNDAFALRRMRALFEQFETVTTNGWGSHVAYALAFGARVSIYGSQPVREESDFLRDTTWAADPTALKKAMSEATHARRDAFLSRLMVDPRDSVADVELGRDLIGADQRLSPPAMLQVLQAIVDPAPVSTGDKRASYQLTRERTFARARALDAAGFRREAIQLLMQAASLDVASKRPDIVRDGLAQVAAEIAPLEPGLAAKIRAELARILAPAGTAASAGKVPA